MNVMARYGNPEFKEMWDGQAVSVTSDGRTDLHWRISKDETAVVRLAFPRSVFPANGKERKLKPIPVRLSHLPTCIHGRDRGSQIQQSNS